MANLVPKRIKIDDKWYRAKEEADGSLNFKNDLYYSESSTQIEYTAKKPNPVLHSGLFHVYNMNGSKVGEFWTDPHVSYSGCVSDIEFDKSNSNSSNYSRSTIPRRHFPEREESSGCLGWIFSIIIYLIFSNWGGRIGVILGVIFTIIMIASASDAIEAILGGLVVTFLLGIAGFIVNAILNFIIKLVKKNE